MTRFLVSLASTTLVVSLLSACHPRHAKGPRAARPDTTANQTFAPIAPILSLKRCVNLGNGLDAPSEGEWGVILSDEHFITAKAAGFDHIRLPVRFSAHADDKAPYTIDPKFFERVDWALAQAKSQGLAVILDMHHFNELMDDPDGQSERFLGLWKQIAERYSSQPETLLFELLNEPCKNLNPPKLNALYKRAIDIVRASNPTRIIMLDSYFWSSTSYLQLLQLPNDPNIVAHFHTYQPILFTHQGAPWMDPEYGTVGVAFPAPPSKRVEPVEAAQQIGWVRDWFKGYNTLPAAKNPGGAKTIVDEFDRASAFAQHSGHRVYLGEFGAIDNADMTSRVNYLTTVRTEAERRNMAWCVWDDGDKMQLLKPQEKSWVPELKQALIP